MKIKRNHIFFILLYIFHLSALGQQKRFSQLSVNDGLSHSDVICLAQDNYSYLWIGTNSGLNKYDGYSFETQNWEPNDITSIPGNRILKLVTTKDKIWLLIEHKGLYYYNILTESYSLVKKIPKLDPLDFMFELDIEGNLWLFHKTIGLFKISIPGTISSFKKKITEKKIFFRKKEVTTPNLKKIIKVGEKEYFISKTGEFFKYSNEFNELILYDNFKRGTFRTALTYNNSEVLIALEDGLFSWNSISKKKQKIPIIFKNTASKEVKLNCIYKYNEVYYLGTENGLYKAKLITNNGLKLIINNEAISKIKVNSIFIDKYNMLWIASSGYGLFYKNLNKTSFGHIYQPKENIDDISNNYTSAILKERNSDTLWLGTQDGLYHYDLISKKHTKQIKELKNEHIRFLFEDSKNEIWVGTKSDGVYRFKNKKLIKQYHKQLDNSLSISSNHIISISEDHLGRIWLANYENGIDIYNKNSNSFQHLFNEPFNSKSLASNNLNFLFFEKNKKYMYVSTRDAGITVIQLLEEKEKLHYIHIGSERTSSKLSTNYVWSINSHNSDTLFVGTIGGGLNILKRDKNNKYQVEYVTRRMGLASNDIESILLDNQNRVWMGGKGLSVYDLKTKRTTKYDINDGLQSNSFKINSSFYDEQNGIMYFGGVNGVNFFDPNLVKPVTLASDVSISGIEIFNEQIKIGDTINDRVLLHSKITDSTTITLKPQENDFTINITPLNFATSKSNKIRYRLVPYQKNWIDRSFPDFKATYSNLPAGDYIFDIKVPNKHNIWYSKKTKLKIRIEQYWYKTKLAVFFYFISIFGVIYLFIKQAINREKIKEKLITAKKEQLLNQGKLDFFTKISHEIRTPLTLIAGPLNDLIKKPKANINKKETLLSMSRHVNRLLNMTNKLLDFRKMELGHDVLKASPTEINEFVYNIFMFFKGKAFSKIINYQFIKLPQEIILYIDKEKIETILINLISNAFKFTPNNGSIIVKLEIKGDKNKDSIFNKTVEPVENYVKISITDTGMGIPSPKKDKIFNQYYQIEENSSFQSIGNGIGLALVKSTCDLHHLKIDVESKTKKGSVFSIRIPLGKNYLGKDEIIDTTSFTKSKTQIVLHQTPIIEFNKDAIDIAKTNMSLNKKILVVEDNAEISLYLNQHLKEYFKVFNAENGAIGFETAMKEKPDIIISDVMMPEMNGMEFSKLIKTNDSLHHIPIILLTALSSTSHELEGLKLGIEDYVRKPFEIDILLAKIFAILENRKFISEYYAKQLHFTPNSIDALTDDDIFLRKLIKFIEENLTDGKFNIAYICEHMGMGRTKLYVKIKEITGKSIVKFIRDVKLKKAEKLLLNTSQTIEHISAQVGINDVKYFRKNFKEMFGLNPSQYRKRKI
ncbi:hybrid sensor histidine kinase/response regulator transcription factor [Algibacter mikhailovii]|uniref:hybrid sensor histidine kinase/response regulator transcription factor n=1 Tax=Algibacter mikhailovii TaxID=425498 RepID=UPI0024955E6E|nr:response regulator [Algibacter mikhailovii]